MTKFDFSIFSESLFYFYISKLTVNFTFKNVNVLMLKE